MGVGRVGERMVEPIPSPVVGWSMWVGPMGWWESEAERGGTAPDRERINMKGSHMWVCGGRGSASHEYTLMSYLGLCEEA